MVIRISIQGAAHDLPPPSTPPDEDKQLPAMLSVDDSVFVEYQKASLIPDQPTRPTPPRRFIRRQLSPDHVGAKEAIQRFRDFSCYRLVEERSITH